jgi:hypothetical protein
LYGVVDGCLVGDVELEDFQRVTVRGGPSAHLLGGFAVLAVNISHRRKHVMAATGQGPGDALPEAAAGARDQDGLR